MYSFLTFFVELKCLKRALGIFFESAMAMFDILISFKMAVLINFDAVTSSNF